MGTRRRDPTSSHEVHLRERRALQVPVWHGEANVGRFLSTSRSRATCTHLYGSSKIIMSVSRNMTL